MWNHMRHFSSWHDPTDDHQQSAAKPTPAQHQTRKSPKPSSKEQSPNPYHQPLQTPAASPSIANSNQELTEILDKIQHSKKKKPRQEKKNQKSNFIISKLEQIKAKSPKHKAVLSLEEIQRGAPKVEKMGIEAGDGEYEVVELQNLGENTNTN